jgi:hypothetical protein
MLDTGTTRVMCGRTVWVMREASVSLEAAASERLRKSANDMLFPSMGLLFDSTFMLMH